MFLCTAVGRPRKNFFPSHTQSQLYHDEDISNEVEKMYQEALQLSSAEISRNQPVETAEVVETSEPGTNEEEHDGKGRKESDENDEKSGDANQEGSKEVVKIKQEPVSEEEQSGSSGHSHRMTTRGKRVPVYSNSTSVEGDNQGRFLTFIQTLKSIGKKKSQ